MDNLFDIKAIVHQRRIAHHRAKDNHIYKEVVASILEHLALANQRFPKVLHYGYSILPLSDFGTITQDLVTNCYEEELELNNSYDLIISSLSMHCINNPDMLLQKYVKHLNKGGMLLLSFFGEETYNELREPLAMLDISHFDGAGVHLMPKITVKDAARLMQKAGLRMPVADCERIVVNYSSLAALRGDVKALGLANCLVNRGGKYLGKAYYESLTRLVFGQKFPISYDLITAIGWKA